MPAQDPLAAPFLHRACDRGAARAATAPAPASAAADERGRLDLLVRRCAGAHWPDPAVVLLLLLTIAGGAFVADLCTGSVAGAGAAALPDFAVAAAASAPPLGGRGPDETSGPAIFAALVLVGSMMLCQVACEKLLTSAVVRALHSLDEECLGVRVELGRMRVWIFLGAFEARGCFVRNPAGYRSDHLLHVRRLRAEFGLRRFLLSLGCEVGIRSLRLEGVDAVIERVGGAGEGTSNVEACLAHLEKELTRPREVRPQSNVACVEVADFHVHVLGGRHVAVPDLAYTDFTKEKGAGTMEQTAATLLKEMCEAALVGARG